MNYVIENQTLPHPDKTRHNIADGTATKFTHRLRWALTLAIKETG